MLEFLHYRHCPEENPPHETPCCFTISAFLFSFIIISFVRSSSYLTRHFYVYQAQPDAFTAYCAVIQK